MARPEHGLLLAVCLLVLHQVTAAECCSTPPPPSPSPSPADHLDDAPRHQLLMLDAGARTARPPAPTRTEAVSAVGTVASWLVREGMTPDQAEVLLRRSKLARRFLAGAGVDEAGSATDGTTPSCRSFNPHANCPPASKP